jgi:2-dehydropantoate 2-reductase
MPSTRLPGPDERRGLHMKICVVGAGAIGGLLAAKLQQSGAQVSVIARGPHLAAIRADGLRLIEEDGSKVVARVAATDRIADAGPQDLVVLGMKAHQVAAVAADLKQLYGPETMVLTAQNGIPWWYFFKHGGPFEGRRLESVDPGGVVAANLPIERVLASVVYPAAEIAEPGLIKHIEGNRFSLAEIDNTETPRVKLVSETLKAAGFKAPVVTDIRSELWTKLWGNLSFNPVSALTHATLEDLCRYPLTRALVADMMREAQSVGEAVGIRFRISIEKRIAGGEAVGKHKTSMLQDIEAGRAVEADAIIGSVIELGQIVNVPTPHLDTAYALVKLLSKTLQDQNGRLRIAST